MFDTSSPGFGAAIDPPVGDDLADLMVAFVATDDGDDARALVEQHPELRTVEVISGLADLAGSAELEEDIENHLRERLSVLCGPEWPEGPVLVQRLAEAAVALVGTRSGQEVVDRSIGIARQASDPAITDFVHSGLLAGLLTVAGEVFLLGWRSTSDHRLLDEASAVARRAAAATPGGCIGSVSRTTSLAGNCCLAKFELTGDRALLEEALALRRRAVTSAPVDRIVLPMLLDELAVALDLKHVVTGHPELLAEAIAAERRAVALLEGSSVGDPTNGSQSATGDLLDASPTWHIHMNCLGNLARYLTIRGRRLRDADLLEEATALCRRALAGTPDDAPFLDGRLDGLAHNLRERYDMVGGRALLDEAVMVQRRALSGTAPAHTAHVRRALALTSLLVEQSSADGHARVLDDAWSIVEDLDPDSPSEQAGLARTRARLVRADRRRGGRYAAAARELTVAVEAVEHMRRAAACPVRRRDLAREFDGLLGDLVANTARSGDVERAVGVIEADRVWLAAPTGAGASDGGNEARASTPPVPVAWVASSEWETVVVTTTDHEVYSAHVIDRTRVGVHRAVAALLNAKHPQTDTLIDEIDGRLPEMQQAEEDLCALTTDIAALFPEGDRLLVVGVGLCALLPYAAARRGDGYLTDQTTLTVAPSLAWARAAHRPRPGGPSVGAFHPGHNPDRALRLDIDRDRFETLVDAAILDRPTAEDTLALLAPDTDIGHISCHGNYDDRDPFSSLLQLETPLTVRAVLDHPGSPWLVNLSACSTAICDIGAAEQQISFPTAFLLSGAAHVLAHLWPTEARLARMFDTVLYRRLAEGHHPADARRHAVQHVRDAWFVERGGELPPYYWAQLTHFGSPW